MERCLILNLSTYGKGNDPRINSGKLHIPGQGGKSFCIIFIMRLIWPLV